MLRVLNRGEGLEVGFGARLRVSVFGWVSNKAEGFTWRGLESGVSNQGGGLWKSALKFLMRVSSSNGENEAQSPNVRSCPRLHCQRLRLDSVIL